MPPEIRVCVVLRGLEKTILRVVGTFPPFRMFLHFLDYLQVVMPLVRADACISTCFAQIYG